MRTKHFSQLVGMSALWGASFPLLRIASPALGPWVTAGARCVLAAVVLALLMLALRRRWPARRDWPALAALSLASVVLPFVLFNWAALTLPAGYSAVLNATVPLFGVMGAALTREERLTTRRLVGCAVGFMGVALLVRLGPVAVTPAVVWAALACIAAAASYGFGAVYMKRATTRHDPLTASATVHVAASMILLLPAAAAMPEAHFSTRAAIAVAVLGIVTSGFMYWVSLRLMREIPASAATSAAFMIPLFGVTWGALFLGEPVTASMLPGGVLILAAMALVTGFNPFRAAPPEP
ncbi:MAG: permease [Polaromonas sp. 39-63-203]|jgi:drug/metabolite transporter (DMT)-like permease|uniref:DMT family transporter n=1 Tax=Polaromonas sp. TaxID=1869339 RepID=UPI000BCEA989|nr:DMT family transporter [Polaromonas sp.]OYY53335.1 MAG: permease [Polaromonas sp. 35-63-240]OYY99922.1 MAG: permease [Polaromonas sp. 28-63-22]OYZ84449.1 MAG: permease [Polaromonas sp. 24-62-144]OZA97635.1 MAG: permease [Polaromonas sp. 39-63-203]HQS32324.1 DMT family transporter [Polaromonas sp.]